MPVMENTSHSLMGAGLHGENGFDPETSISLLIGLISCQFCIMG